MLGRLVLSKLTVGGRIRDAASIYRSPFSKSSLTGGCTPVGSQIRSFGCRIYNSAVRRSENYTIKFSLVHRLSLALLTGTGIKLLACQITVHCSPYPNNKFAESNLDQSTSQFDWGRFWLMLKPYIWYLLAAIGSALVVAVLNIQVPLVLGQVVNVLTTVLKNNERIDLRQKIMEPASKLFLLYGTQAFFTFVYIYLLSCVGEGVASSMKRQLFSSVLSQDLVFFDTFRTGDIVSRLTIDIQDFKSSFKLCVSHGIRSITQIVGCGVSLFLVSPNMACGMLLAVAGVIVVGTAFGSLLRQISEKAQFQSSKATLISEQAISNIRTVRAFAMEQAECEKFSNEVEESCRINRRLGFGIGIFQGGSNLFLNGLILGTLYVGGKLIIADQLAAGDLMAFLVATQTIQRSLSQLSLLLGQVMKGMAAGARVFAVINLEPQMRLTGGKKIPYHSFLGEVKFNDVSFSYPTRPEQKILKNFFLRLAPGTTVAVVGTSGNGKSTIAALLERFYDVDDGSITIDGIDIRELDPSWLRGNVIGFINQEPILFADSVMENIRYGRLDATDDEVIEVAKIANADDFISEFPDGYKTVVGERGVTVSGGQKQRIAIARALLKNPSILILDEATSALDAESEKLVQNALDELALGRTVLVIAHRLSSVRNADVIVVLNNGVIVEKGSHDSLMDRRGLYWSLFNQQSNNENSRSQA